MKLGRFRIDPLGFLGIILLIAIWLALLPISSRSQLPDPIGVLRKLADGFFYARSFQYFGLTDHSYFEALSYTVQNVVISVTIGSVIGIILGLFSARLSNLRAFVDPIVLTVGTVPIFIAAPFLLMWFGEGRMDSILIVSFYVAVTLYTYALRAAVNLNPVYEASARAFGASDTEVVRSVLVPGTLPEILGGIRIALASSWGIQAVAELLCDQRGIGKVIRSISMTMDVEGVFAALILLGFTAMLIDVIAAFIIAKLSSWRAQSASISR